MKIEIDGASELAKTLNTLEDVIVDSFWEDVEVNLFKNIERMSKKYNDTGTLSRNIYSDSGDGYAEVGIRDDGMMVNWDGAKVNYASFILHGTRAHMIKPKDKKALRWVSGSGRFAFSKGHMVSGIKKDNFLEKSALKTFDNLQKILDRQLKKSGVY